MSENALLENNFVLFDAFPEDLILLLSLRYLNWLPSNPDEM
jgi:hypothetical protein